MRAVSRATGLVEGSLDQTIKELRDQIIEYCRAGRAVKVDGLGTWTTTIGLDGTLDIQYRADPAINSGLNIPGIFTGTIVNRENIGKTSDELVAKWNEAYPQDQVVFSDNFNPQPNQSARLSFPAGAFASYFFVSFPLYPFADSPSCKCGGTLPSFSKL